MHEYKSKFLTIIHTITGAGIWEVQDDSGKQWTGACGSTKRALLYIYLNIHEKKEIENKNYINFLLHAPKICLHNTILITTISATGMSQQEESQSTPALIHMPETVDLTSSLGMIPENTLLESCTRLSVSLEENGLFQVLHHLWAQQKSINTLS